MSTLGSVVSRLTAWATPRVFLTSDVTRGALPTRLNERLQQLKTIRLGFMNNPG